MWGHPEMSLTWALKQPQDMCGVILFALANWVETGAGAMPGSQGQHKAALSTRVECTPSLRAGSSRHAGWSTRLPLPQHQSLEWGPPFLVPTGLHSAWPPGQSYRQLL